MHQRARQDDGAEREKQQYGDDEKDVKPVSPSSASFKDRIAHFTWPWFATTMSTGAVAVVLSNTPNTFPGLTIIGEIFFVLQLILFILFTIAMALRAYWFPRRFLRSLHHPVEGLFFGSYWVSVSLILNAAQGYGVPKCGPWLPVALRVCFWTYCAIVLIIAVAQYYSFFQEERLHITDAMPAWMFPIYPLLVVGTMGGTMIPSQPHGHAFDMWVGSVMLQGLAWIVALMMYAMYMQRLMTSALPSPPTRPGMYVSVGPSGYTAAGLISLGKLAIKVLPSDTFHAATPTPDDDILRVLGIIAGIFIILFAFWFFCISTVAVLAGIREMHFTLNWWAFVFPNAGLTLATIQIGSVFGSRVINGISSALTIILVILWLMTAAFHIRAVVRGEIMWPGKDEDKDMKDKNMKMMGWGRYSA